MWKKTERKKVPPAPPRRGAVYAAAGLGLLLIPMGWLGFGTETGALATVSKGAFVLIAVSAALALAAGRRRSRVARRAP